MNRCARVLVSLQHTQKFHPKDLELHVTQLFKNSLLITSVLWVFNQIFFDPNKHCLVFKVVRNSFPFSITAELYERFTRL